jgi:hypothetical protein
MAKEVLKNIPEDHDFSPCSGSFFKGVSGFSFAKK